MKSLEERHAERIERRKEQLTEDGKADIAAHVKEGSPGVGWTGPETDPERDAAASNNGGGAETDAAGSGDTGKSSKTKPAFSK